MGDGSEPGRWLTEAEAAQYIRVATSTLRRYRSQGKIGFTRLDRKVLYSRDVLDAFLESRAVPATR